jgi:hypothetical protein
MKLCAKWQQKFGYALEAPNYKHQTPNNIEISISNDRNGFVSEFGHLVIGNYLEFGIWILGFQCLFSSGYAGLGVGREIIFQSFKPGS